MSDETSSQIPLEQIRQSLFTAVVCDALDAVGLRNQSPGIPLLHLCGPGLLAGRCRTTLWTDIDGRDPDPYALELAAVDACQPDDVLIAAAGGSMRSGIWGELLTTAASRRGCVGAIVDGAVRDITRIETLGFSVFARGPRNLDSLHRQRVTDVDLPVVLGGVTFHPGDLVLADSDGVVVVPADAEQEVIAGAWQKTHAEDHVRQAIQAGMTATDAYRRYGVL